MRRRIESIVDVRPGELTPALLAAAQFFCLLFGYFMLRPLRETMGLEGGVDSLRLLFLATVGVMIAGNVAYGFFASRVRRGVLVPAVYVSAIASLGVFLVLFYVMGEGANAAVGKVFYVWLSVFNLFAVSVFWSLLADVFTLEQGKRLFGFIGVGGTAGAIAGSSYAWTLAERIGPVGLMTSAAVLIAVSAFTSALLSRRAHEGGRTGEAVGGASWSGLSRMIRSPYLAGIGATVLLYAVMSTLLYFEKMRIVEAVVEGGDARTSLFAGIELAGQSLTIVLQVLLTGRMMRWFGVGVLLMIVPLVSIVGFSALGLMPTLVVVAVFEATRRASNFALTKPARETLFTVVPRADKYKAKAAIDTFVYRGGDTVGTLADKVVGVVGASVAVLAVPLGICAVGLAWWLGREERRLAGSEIISVESNSERGRHASVAS